MNPEVLALSLSVIILLFSIIVHEVMHGLVALRFGDHTAENQGRLTLNPIPHIDPIGSILLPLLSFVSTGRVYLAWAKPVPINPLNFTDIRRGELFVSLAGVVSNFALAIIAALTYHLLPGNSILLPALQFAVGINLSLGIFNLIPIPPLDGSKVVMSFLPYKAARSYESFTQYGMFILLGLIYFGFIGFILTSIVVPLQYLLGVSTY